MRKRMLLALAGLTLGLVAAQTTTPTAPTPTTTTVNLPGTVPASVTRVAGDLWSAFYAAGGTVQLLDAGGVVIGTVNADGTVALIDPAKLSDAKSVLVTPAAGQGEAQTFILSRDLSLPGAIKFQWTLKNGQVVSLPLAAIANRLAHAHDSAAPGAQKPDGAGKPEGKGKPEKPGKSGEHGNRP